MLNELSSRKRGNDVAGAEENESKKLNGEEAPAGACQNPDANYVYDLYIANEVVGSVIQDQCVRFVFLLRNYALTE
jgi:hypothetical protein